MPQEPKDKSKERLRADVPQIPAREEDPPSAKPIDLSKLRKKPNHMRNTLLAGGLVAAAATGGWLAREGCENNHTIPPGGTLVAPNMNPKDLAKRLRSEQIRLVFNELRDNGPWSGKEMDETIKRVTVKLERGQPFTDEDRDGVADIAKYLLDTTKIIPPDPRDRFAVGTSYGLSHERFNQFNEKDKQQWIAAHKAAGDLVSAVRLHIIKQMENDRNR